MSALLTLVEHGQSYWMDNLTRDMLANGGLAQRVRRAGLRGITANPSTFEKAVTGSHAYDAQIRQAARAGLSAAAIYEELAVTDVRNACDLLRNVYDHTRGKDGYVSLEVSPHLAHDADASIEEARRLSRAVDRPNLMIKIPGTKEGLRAIETLLFEGINVNITLLFSVERYQEVAEAYMRALEQRLTQAHPIDAIASVASFFLSRIDVLVDELLGHRVRPDGTSAFEPHPDPLRGKAAVASAKLAYRSFQRIVRSERWKALAAQGAAVQRLLWASTSTKNPEYPDLMYVEPLIGPDTVNTMPEQTIAAFANHGKVADTLGKGITQATQVGSDLRRVGINLKLVGEQLENEGIEKFSRSYDSLLRALEAQRARYGTEDDLAPLGLLARKLRREVIRMTTQAGSGHPTSCMSAAEIVAALFFRIMRWDPSDPRARDVDTFLLSKGHAAPILWAALAEAGALDEDPLTLRRIDSTLEGHPTPRNPWVHVATGSLGQGLSAANGIALANRLDGIDARVFCLLGDGECSEGAVWEAAQFASLNRLGGIVAIVDENGFGQSAAAPYDHDSRVFAERFRAFGWRAYEIDGHDLAEVIHALEQAGTGHQPTAIVARTIKGKGVSFLENRDDWHGKALDREQMERALAELGETDFTLRVPSRRLGKRTDGSAAEALAIDIGYRVGDQVATRDGFGRALRQIGRRPDIVVLDGDVKDSTRAADFAESFPERFFEGYIAEQNMVGTALGLAVSGKLPFVATFACFLTRAADFIRMAGHSRPRHLVFCGSHAGISIGQDGPSQMGLEDIAMFRALGESTVLYPCDAVSAMRLTAQAAVTDGIVYLRTSRPKTPVIYDAAETFPVGGSKTLRSSAEDKATVVAAGITVHEALAAHALLAGLGVKTGVIDAYSVKPIDARTLRAAAETGPLIVVEDHWVDGGLGDAVASAVAGAAKVLRLGVREEPRSGNKDELLERFGISRHAIVDAVREVSNAELPA